MSFRILSTGLPFGGFALDRTMRNSAGVTSNVGVICNARALDNAVVIVIVGVICSVGSLGNTMVIVLGVFDNVWGERDS